MSLSPAHSIVMNAPSSLPEWYTALSYNTPTQVGTGNMRDVSANAGLSDGESYGLTSAWCGTAVNDETGELCSGLNGGHNDSGSQNGVQVFRMFQDTPSWASRRVGQRNGGAQGGMNGPGTYPSGQPSGTHHYNRLLVADDVLWMPGMDSIDDGPGNHTPSTFSFDLSQAIGGEGTWRSHGRWTTGDASNKLLGGSACFDGVTKRIFTTFQYGSQAAYFHAPTVLAASDVAYPGTVPGVTAMSMPSTPSYSWMTCDEARRLVIYVSTGNIQSLNPDNPAGGWTWRTGSAPPNTPYGGGYCYHKAVSRIYSCPWGGGGSTIRVYDVPESGGWPSTWRTVNLNGSLPAATNWGNGGQGPFTRLNIVQDMGNGEACLVYYPGWSTTGMWVVRLQAGGL